MLSGDHNRWGNRRADGEPHAEAVEQSSTGRRSEKKFPTHWRLDDDRTFCAPPELGSYCSIRRARPEEGAAQCARPLSGSAYVHRPNGSTHGPFNFVVFGAFTLGDLGAGVSPKITSLVQANAAWNQPLSAFTAALSTSLGAAYAGAIEAVNANNTIATATTRNMGRNILHPPLDAGFTAEAVDPRIDTNQKKINSTLLLGASCKLLVHHKVYRTGESGTFRDEPHRLSSRGVLQRGRTASA